MQHTVFSSDSFPAGAAEGRRILLACAQGRCAWLVRALESTGARVRVHDPEARAAEEAPLSDPRPDLIILLVDGLSDEVWTSFMNEAKSRQDSRLVPLIVFGSSLGERQIEMVYDLRANCYVPVEEGKGAAELLDVIEHFWLGMVKLPG